MRDFRGYGQSRPSIEWAPSKTTAVSIILNYEEGGEYTIPDGDGFSEATLTDAGHSIAPKGVRDRAAESMFEFGSRLGVWRLLGLFEEFGVNPTMSTAALALERNPELVDYVKEKQLAVQSHGYRWINHLDLSIQQEREEIAKAIASFLSTLGRLPKGWMCRYGPSLNTATLLQEYDSFVYHSDSYADELPYWDKSTSRPMLVIPHTFANNDNKFGKGWFATGDDFVAWHKAALDTVRRENGGLLTISLHCRVSGHAARADGLRRFLDYATSFEDVAFLNRDQIFQEWSTKYPASDVR